MRCKKYLLSGLVVLMAVTIVVWCGVSLSAAAAELPAAPQVVTVDTGYYDDGYDDYYDDYYNDYYNDDYRGERPSSSSEIRTPKPKNWLMIIGCTIVIPAVAALVFVIGTISSYKHNGKTEPYPYNNKAPLELTEADDILVDTDIRRVRIQRDPPPPPR